MGSYRRNRLIAWATAISPNKHYDDNDDDERMNFNVATRSWLDSAKFKVNSVNNIIS